MPMIEIARSECTRAALPTCKCCGGQAATFGLVDSARACQPGAFPPSGEAVRYLRCAACGFVFTDHFDAWSDARMAAEIYNADYVRADPDFVRKRPHFFAGAIQALIGAALTGLQALDYGGGAGLLARLMREAGAARYDSYDPFLGDATAPSGPYGLVTAFEVFEHTRNPPETMRDALAHLAPDGGLLFSTALRPRRASADWWYVAPRNGHVSIHTASSLTALGRRCGVDVVSLDEGLHLAYRRAGAIPRLVLRQTAQRALYHASQRGPVAWARVAATLARAGQTRRALDPRHAARALRWAWQS